MIDAEKLYNTREVMAILGRSTRTIYAYVRSGLLPAVKQKDTPHGNSKLLILGADLQRFIDNGGAPAGYYQKLYPRPSRSEKRQ